MQGKVFGLVAGPFHIRPGAGQGIRPGCGSGGLRGAAAAILSTHQAGWPSCRVNASLQLRSGQSCIAGIDLPI